MGIRNPLCLLPGGGKYRQSFFGSEFRQQDAVSFDAAGALWQFAAMNAADFLRGNDTPALTEWTRFLNYIRSICGYKLVVYIDGRKKIHKLHKNHRRRQRATKDWAKNDLRGQIQNTPNYFAKAVAVCRCMGV